MSHFLDALEDESNRAMNHFPRRIGELTGAVGALLEVVKNVSYITESTSHGYRSLADAHHGLTYTTYAGEETHDADLAKAQVIDELAAAIQSLNQAAQQLQQAQSRAVRLSDSEG